ncbi:hypothetical protein LZ554_005038 [Drepanopeziza brunnea f. sp. 'monogermtubi']|nr:hypothetical protein LZ554_005038 [Drepanopeziza brunnea f. sp. 'monogermtubi']
MAELFRDTTLGKLLRVSTRGRLMQYAEERNPALWRRYVDSAKSGRMAHHGTTEEEKQAEGKEGNANGDDVSRGYVERGSPKGGYRHLGTNAGNGDQSDMRPTGTGTNEPHYPHTRADVRQRESGIGRKSSDATVGDGEDRQTNEVSGVAIDPEKGRDVSVVDWYGENDPENPQNWSSGKKAFVTGMICLLTFSIYIGSAIYSAGTQGVMERFGVSQVAATLGLTLFVAGYGVGPMIWSSMSEIPQFGRNPVYVGTLIVFVFFQFAVIYAKNFGMLLAFRFLTGFFGSPVLATGGASISDMYAPQKRAYGIAIWGTAALCGPVLGPLIGGFAVQHKNWQWAIWELLWLSGFALIMMILFLPETSSANILYRRSRRLRKLTGRSDLKCEPELASEQMSVNEIAMMTLVRPFSLMILEPVLLLLNAYIALIYGLLYAWFESFAIVFQGTYGFNLGELGLSFVGILVGGIVTLPCFLLYLKYIQEPHFNEEGEIKPEIRLQPAFVGAFCIPICMFWFGWTARESIHWIVPIIGSAFFTVGAFLMFNSVLNYLGDAYPAYAASVLAGNDFFRSSFGAGFPLFSGAMYRRLGINWASSLLGFLSILFIPIPFILYKSKI